MQKNKEMLEMNQKMSAAMSELSRREEKIFELENELLLLKTKPSSK